MQTNHFQELLDKYLTGRMTEQEWKNFSELLNVPEHKNRLAAIIDTELTEHAFDGEPDNNTLAAIQENLYNNLQAGKERSARIIYYMKRLAVAAVFIMMLSAVAWWLISKKPAQPEIAQKNKVKKETPLVPGGNRAILKLSDGTEIILDSAGDGTLVQQGQAKVIKLGDGRLSYQSTGNTSAEPVYNTISTPRGGQYQLILADGSKVWLNASSSLRYPAFFAGSARKVELTGEGYFEVAKNATMPFHVQVNNMDVEVLGTHFNINSYTDEPVIRTTLLEGSVIVKSAGRDQNSAILKPGEQAVLSGDNSPLTIHHSPDLDEVMAWKNGLFQFKAADIKTVLRQAERWYDVQFEYKENIPARFSGQISRSANADQLLKILELTGKVKFEYQGKTIIVTR
jgi:ferric-dicitrate binding protein FerR (iron transport regulator)